MKYLEKPVAIEVGAKIAFSFDDYIRFLVSTCREFNSTGDGIRAGYRVEEALDNANGKLTLKNELYELLVAASETPSAGYPVLNAEHADGTKSTIQIARQLLPFIDAIKNAKDEAPA